MEHRGRVGLAIAVAALPVAWYYVEREDARGWSGLLTYWLAGYFGIVLAGLGAAFVYLFWIRPWLAFSKNHPDIPEGLRKAANDDRFEDAVLTAIFTLSLLALLQVIFRP